MFDYIRHNKRGSCYEIIGEGELQVSTQPHISEGTLLTIYKSVSDGKIWIRPTSEVNDPNRFQKIKGEIV